MAAGTGFPVAWESRPDNGQSHALDEGFKRTTGEIMYYINSDDLLLPGAHHGDEVPRNADGPWWAICGPAGHRVLKQVPLSVRRVKDPLLDTAGEMTGAEPSGRNVGRLNITLQAALSVPTPVIVTPHLLGSRFFSGFPYAIAVHPASQHRCAFR